MTAHPLPPQCSQRENRCLCDVVSAFIDWNAPEIHDRPPLPFQKSCSNRALEFEERRFGVFARRSYDGCDDLRHVLGPDFWRFVNLAADFMLFRILADEYALPPQSFPSPPRWGPVARTILAICCLARAGASGNFVVMTATISAVCCLARAGTSKNFVMMMATISAVCCLARAGTSGNFVMMTATISAVCCLARAGASGYLS